MSIKLTAFSHGAGCGCKLSPAVLSTILSGEQHEHYRQLLVGNDTRDDAAVYQIDDENAVISTTDFFMPIVDDPFDFGAIAATNAISDVYAMGGTPIMAIAILGWPIDKLDPAIAGEVMKGGREVCKKAGIPLAGGHSIDAPEPIFGLAVTGKVKVKNLKTNAGAKPDDLIYLTKPLGIGLVTTAQKKGLAAPEDLKTALDSMTTLNSPGETFSQYDYVNALTDVTGFGLAGHLLEILEASKSGAEIFYDKIPRFSFTDKYLDMGTTPGGTQRNWASYGENVDLPSDMDDFRLLADPQTSGGLLVIVRENDKDSFEEVSNKLGYNLQPIGRVLNENIGRIKVV